MEAETATPLPRLPPQPHDAPWPTQDWPLGEIEPAARRAAVDDLVAGFFAPRSAISLGATHALLIVQRGKLVVERYGPDYGPDKTCHSWSMAKSITHALVGMAVGDGRFDIAQRAHAPEWRSPGDPRAAITVDQLLRMSSGLEFVEEYTPGEASDVIEMLFGSGKEDVAAYAASRPLAHSPGGFMAYASGATNIVSRALGRALGLDRDGFYQFMRERLFEPLGITSAAPKFDAAGTFIGSSYCFCTPRDFARFGLLYLRDGLWEGRRLLPEGWVDYGRTPTWRQPDAVDGPYGAHWWLDGFGPGVFSANGHDGQYIILRPDRDLIVVRNGLMPPPAKQRLLGRLTKLVALFD
jgi:CubicO group peptidase (beta-lactamase class C family)